MFKSALLSLRYVLKYNKHVQNQYHRLKLANYYLISPLWLWMWFASKCPSIRKISYLLWLLKAIKYCREEIAISMSLDVWVIHFGGSALQDSLTNLKNNSWSTHSEAQPWVFSDMVCHYCSEDWEKKFLLRYWSSYYPTNMFCWLLHMGLVMQEKTASSPAVALTGDCCHFQISKYKQGKHWIHLRWLWSANQSLFLTLFKPLISLSGMFFFTFTLLGDPLTNLVK